MVLACKVTQKNWSEDLLWHCVCLLYLIINKTHWVKERQIWHRIFTRISIWWALSTWLGGPRWYLGTHTENGVPSPQISTLTTAHDELAMNPKQVNVNVDEVWFLLATTCNDDQSFPHMDQTAKINLHQHSGFKAYNMDCRRRLRSTSTLELHVPPMHHVTVGDRAFAVSAAHVWNGLPSDVIKSPSLIAFKRWLKTLLFRCSFISDSPTPVLKLRDNVAVLFFSVVKSSWSFLTLRH